MGHKTYDVIVVGGGHAGCEAALAAARLGCDTLMICTSLEGIALMACNPSFGGPAKAHLVREIDALGGQLALCADATAIQMRRLNTAKGPAVQAYRSQQDKRLYQLEMRRVLEQEPRLDLKQATVQALAIEDGQVRGVVTRSGFQYAAKAVVLATGTYLEGRAVTGGHAFASGPSGMLPAVGLSGSLQGLGLRVRRFKTGTPPRLDGRTVDYSRLTIQPGDDEPLRFSFMSELTPREQLSCWLTHTTAESHRIIRENLHRSPMYDGTIEGVGPRYCPSIEDKIVRFAEKESHQVFLEPEGWQTYEMYVAGLSTSLPEEVQWDLVRSLPGCEEAEIMRPGYAIEYDCFDATQLKPSLETRHLRGLFTAGQANGTSGYEEAAAQGLIAGINAARLVQGQEPFILRRDQAYIGVLIDDLVTKGLTEPYRMMTARAEYRLLLRQDNADLRLTPLGREIGLVSDERWERFRERQTAFRSAVTALSEQRVTPTDETNTWLTGLGSSPLQSGTTAAQLLRRPEIRYRDLVEKGLAPDLPSQWASDVEVEVKYAGYLAKERQQVERFLRLESRRLPDDLDYTSIAALSTEAREKLSAMRPLTLGQAARIAGVSQADISVLLVYLERDRRGT